MSRFFKKKSDFSKWVVVLDITIFLLYVITNIVMHWIKGYSMPTDINAGVFAFLTGELGLLSFIKRSKIVSETKSDLCNSINVNNITKGVG
jgi:hypothetical protein